VLSQASYYSVNDLRLHFGLGRFDAAERVDVRWPTGAVTRLEHVPAGQTIQVRE
jgi:hypothetical protein